MTDPISDMLTRVKNAYMAHLLAVSVPHSKLKEALAGLLVREGFLKNVKTQGDFVKTLILTLKYEGDQPAITNVMRASKPGRRVYVKKHQTPRVLGDLGVAILSTPQGVMTGSDARKKGLGGEVVCTIW